MAGILGASLIGALVAPGAALAVAASGVDDLITTTEDHATVAGNVLTNDVAIVRNAGLHIASAAPGVLTVASNGDYQFTPAANWSGTNVLVGWYLADPDMLDNSNEMITYVRVTVTAVNDVPVAVVQSVNATEDTAQPITLAGTDTEGSSLTYSIVSDPAHGSLSGTGASQSYTPAADYAGPDSFTFKVNDGSDDSVPATVTITVASANDIPTATPQAVSTNEDAALPITLTGLDPDGAGITFSTVTLPAHGVLTGTGTSRTYTPEANWHGADSFTFKVNDGDDDSAPATVTITVNAANDLPTATAQSVSTNEDVALPIVLAGTDLETASGSLTFAIAAQPAHGTLTGSGANRTYTPEANWNGSDTFTFTANDGTADSAAATVTITVSAVNDLPVADAQALSVVYMTAKPFTLAGADADGQALTFTIVTPPTKGVLSGTAPNLTYTPTGTNAGADSFTFKVSDGGADSAPATVSITIAEDAVAPTVPAPTVAFGAGRVNESAPIKITWSATDAGVGVAGYVVEAKVGTGAWTQIYAGSATTITKPYPFGQSLQWRVKASDANGNWSAFTDSVVRKLHAYQGGSPVAYSGSWRTVASSGSSGVNYRYTTTSGKYAKLTFTNAIGVIYVAPKTSAGGYVKVKIDGTTFARNNLRSTTTSHGVIIRGKAWSSAGTHTIWVYNAQGGRRANVDAFIVLK